MENDDIFYEAKTRIERRKHEKKKKVFFLHVMVFIGAISSWYLTSFSGTLTLSILIPLLIWILLIVRHGISAFRMPGVLNEDRQREILDLEMDRIEEEEDTLDIQQEFQRPKDWDDKDLV